MGCESLGGFQWALFALKYGVKYEDDSWEVDAAKTWGKRPRPRLCDKAAEHDVKLHDERAERDAVEWSIVQGTNPRRKKKGLL